ncbi:hypothetical protein SPI_07808 [Niveomyces insectorum RCEF 264]|uniref:Rhodopsin domain-containing protein n=1 Tax=Niveomyces insectorum RCEF 264 TaxID=1081102 RepID=A0A167P1R6_9HYPO|nr:hypothetical protein SPI_07808 [Niveomyces insectorum RCEF 264]
MASNSTADGPSPSAYSANLNHEDKRKYVLVSIWILTGLSLLFLVARVLCKFCTRRRLWWDDHVMILSWVALLASTVVSTWSVAQGEGLHVWDVPVENYSLIGLLGNLTGTFSILAAVWSKTSFALTLLRLMTGRQMRVVLWLAIASINVAMGLNAVFLWVRCMPLVKTWNPTVPGTCWAPQVYPIYGIFAAGYSAVMDVILALLPWKIVWRLQMKRQEKFGVAIAMSLGVVAGAMAVVKTSQIPTLSSGDFTYASIPLIVWGSAESGVTIMAASIPVLRVLLRDAKQLTRQNYLVSTALSYVKHGTTTVENNDTESKNNRSSSTPDPLHRHPIRDEENVADDERALRSVQSQPEMSEPSSKGSDTYSIRIRICDDE